MCFIHTVHLSPKNPIVFLAKYPSPALCSILTHVLNPALFYNNPFPYPLVDPSKLIPKSCNYQYRNYLPVLITKVTFLFLHKRRYITESERSPLFLEEKNANAIFFQNLYRMQLNKKKQNPQKEMTKKQT